MTTLGDILSLGTSKIKARHVRFTTRTAGTDRCTWYKLEGVLALRRDHYFGPSCRGPEASDLFDRLGGIISNHHRGREKAPRKLSP